LQFLREKLLQVHQFSIPNLFPQYFQQLFRGFFGQYFPELGAVVFNHTDAFNRNVIYFPAAALVGQPVIQWDILRSDFLA
jgi:hypothetical protein